jgi:hypothetical protein
MKVILYPEQLENIKALMGENKKLQAMRYVKDRMRLGGIILGLKEVKVLVESIHARRYETVPTFEYSILPEGTTIVTTVRGMK